MRPLARPYLQHGSRHSRTGSDPIPNLGTLLPIASLFSDPVGVSIAADAASHYASIVDGVSSAGFATTDTDTFENLSSTLFTGSPVFGVGIKAPGTYAVFNNAIGVSGGTGGNNVTAYWSASDGSAPSFFQQGRTKAPTLDTWDGGETGVGPHLFTHEWMTVDTGQTPAVLAVFGEVSGGTAVFVEFQMMVVQLTPLILPKL
jgi:hypothetical protein